MFIEKYWILSGFVKIGKLILEKNNNKSLNPEGVTLFFHKINIA